MSKRKRGEKDQNAGEERHSKIRVQEVDNIVTSKEQPGLMEPTQTAATNTPLLSQPDNEEFIRKAARKKAKQERRAQKKAQKNTDGVAKTAVAQDNGGDTIAAVNKNMKEHHPASGTPAQEDSSGSNIGGELGTKDVDIKRRGSTLTLRSKWTMSDPIGGQMLDLDPIFTKDEQHLLVAYSMFVAVYSTSTSLLIRRLQVQKARIITGIALDVLEEDHILVATSSGEISKWNWKEGQRLNVWQISSKVHALSVARQSLSQEGSTIVYTIEKRDASQWSLCSHRLDGHGGSSKADTKTLLKFQNRLTGFEVLHGGKLVVVSSGQQLIIGTPEPPAPENMSEIKYLWRVVDCPEWIAGFDVQSRPSERTSKKYLSKGGLLEAIDVAIGGLKGTIHIYEDLLQKLVRKENAGRAGNRETIGSRSLHWHRNAVLTVKWSADGNYIISGGQETVLVLWQLETGQKQHLPHLGAPIESIVVSPAGSSYSVRLADNSAIILSTSELRPTFSIAGTQIPTTGRPQDALPFVPSVDARRRYAARPRRARYPACVACPGTDRLLLAVPTSSTSNSSSNVFQHASYLQTCDISSGHQLSRQALTRTKITSLNMGPESNTIEEPNVTHMQISHDGQWLATIDEWTPPKQDLLSLTFDEEAAEQELVARQEIYLKFWSWNHSDQVWELVSRVDNPYAADSGKRYESHRVLDIASNPSTASFSTIGEDGAVKIWVPVARMRREMKIRGKDGEPLTSWRCQLTISTAMSDSSVMKHQVGRLAFAPDGSLLAAAPLASSSPSPIYLIDTATGHIQTIHNGLCSGPILGIGIIPKYLIILSHELLIWDLVNDQLHYGINFHLQTLPSKLISTSLLAIDHRHELFAVALPDTTKRGKVGTKFAIMDPEHPQPLFNSTLPSTITNLLPAIGKKGFYAIDANAEIRTFTPQAAIHPGLPTPPRDSDVTSKGIDSIFGTSQTSDASSKKSKGLLEFSKDTISTEDRLREKDYDAAVVSADKLAEIFDTGSAMSMPPVTELFQQVARLYDGRIDS